MVRQHSWNWLPPRVTRFHSSLPSRPPLAMVEQLEDRVLMSVSEGGIEQALIGLLRQQIGVRNAELEVLKLAGDLVQDKTTPLSSTVEAFLKIEDDFQGIDGALVKIVHSALLGNKMNVDVQMVKIDFAFASLEEEVKFFGENGTGLLLPAVQRVREAALDTIKFANALPAVQLTDHKLVGDFMKFEFEYLKIADITDKVVTTDLAGKLTADKWRLDIVKLDDAFVKLDADIAAMGDGSVFKALSEDLSKLQDNTFNFLTDFTTPSTDGGGDAISITLTDPEGDTIS